MDCVIEVAGGFAVDGNDRQVAVVAAMLQFRCRDDRLDGLRLVDDLGRKVVGQVKLANHDFDVHSEIVFLAQYFDHAPAGTLRGGRPVGNLDVDHYAVEVVPVRGMGGLSAD